MKFLFFFFGTDDRILVALVAPHHSEVFVASAPGTEKNAFVISGDLEVAVGGDSPARLSAGDAILFTADAPYSILNPGDGETKVFLVVTSFDGPKYRGR